MKIPLISAHSNTDSNIESQPAPPRTPAGGHVESWDGAAASAEVGAAAQVSAVRPASAHTPALAPSLAPAPPPDDDDVVLFASNLGRNTEEKIDGRGSSGGGGGEEGRGKRGLMFFGDETFLDLVETTVSLKAMLGIGTGPASPPKPDEGGVDGESGSPGAGDGSGLKMTGLRVTI